MLLNILIALVALAFLACVAWWAYQQFVNSPAPPEPRTYDGISGGSPPAVNELKYDDIPLQSVVSKDPRKALFNNLIDADSELKQLGYTDEERAALIDNDFGKLLFRPKKAE